MSPTLGEQALAAAYVLGALDRADRRRFEAHTAKCAICACEVRSFGRVAEALAWTSPRTPPPGMRARLLARISGMVRPVPTAGRP